MLKRDIEPSTIVIDTTYVLPLFGVEISLNASFKDEIKKLWKNGIKDCKIYLPSVCLIECIYKLNREYRQNSNIEILNRYSQVLPTILTSSNIQVFNSFLDVQTSQMALKIREKGHPDIMDCWIAGSSIGLQGIFVTEDTVLKKVLVDIPEFSNRTILNWKELKRKIDF